MRSIKKHLKTLALSASLALNSCSTESNINKDIEYAVNSAKGTQGQEQQILNFFEEKIQTPVVSFADSFYDMISWESFERRIIAWKNYQINSLFGLAPGPAVNTIPAADFDSFAGIDSLIVEDFAERYSSPLELETFFVDSIERRADQTSVYGKLNYIPSTKVALYMNSSNCLVAAFSLIPAALEDDGYLPIVLNMFRTERRVAAGKSELIYTIPGQGHVIFLYHPELIGETPIHNLYNSESRLGLMFRDFMQHNPGWYTAGINPSDFNGPFDSVDEIVRSYNYCRYITLNLNDYNLDFRYSNHDLSPYIHGISYSQYREDLRNRWVVDLTDKITFLIPNPFERFDQERMKLFAAYFMHEGIDHDKEN